MRKFRPTRQARTTLALACAAALFLSACGGGAAGEQTSTTAGDPVAGGSAALTYNSEPRTLDPAALSNTWAHQAVLGNALYGTLIVNNVDTLAIEYKMATDFSTTDGGRTFTLKLRPGLQFTDGTPLDAAAVKFNWDRLRDPALASTSLRQAAQVASSDAVDATTLHVTMTSPSPHFPQNLLAGAMNWIASPTALQKGQAAFDAEPVGAGPFTLTKWMRQDVIELSKNTGYWDAPRPYLDSITLRAASDNAQRLNAVTTGAVDVAAETSWANLAKAKEAGFPTQTVPLGGGQFIGMNFRRAPFDDPRARRAVILAIDPESVNVAVYNGKGQVPATLFQKNSPYFTDIALPSPDKVEAQKLFDELAAEGKPVSFAFTTYPTPEAKATAESVQAQLSAFENVEAKVDVVDFTAATARTAAHDFDMTITSALIQDPDSGLWNAFHSASRGNTIGIDDLELTAALDAGRVAEDPAERTEAYETVQKRLVALNPGIWYVRSSPSVITGRNVHGALMYGLGSPLPEELWFQN
ncbi:ABC transporter substrate-binding protein [Rhodococcus sp. 24CO]|uniref:ABC transporter substrate-binding protein n=1 Tax=Rhodococcus sp. 24CO TaxID=3117460 RepID=UPI003D359AC7